MTKTCDRCLNEKPVRWYTRHAAWLCTECLRSANK